MPGQFRMYEICQAYTTKIRYIFIYLCLCIFSILRFVLVLKKGARPQNYNKERKNHNKLWFTEFSKRFF